MKSEARFRPWAFTLFEVMMALGVFVFLVGGIYFSVSSAVSSSIHLGTVQMEVRQQTAFVRFLREGFLHLPAGAKISLRTREAGGSGRAVELLIEPASGAFETGVLESQGSGVILAMIPDGKGTGCFSLQRFDSGLGENERDRSLEGGSWLRVLEDIQSVRWRFWDRRERKFIETWDHPEERPELVELNFSVTGGNETTAVFRLPVLSASAGRSNPPPAP
jgi:hypothetical protein